MKPIKLVHPSHARSIASPDDVERYQRAGWLKIDDAKALNPNAAKQHRYRERARKNGLRQLEVWLPESAFVALKKLQRPGETQAAALVRLLCPGDTEPDSGHQL